MNPDEPKGKYHDGRDEMNLADFPISALQRQQPSDADGRKRDRLEFEATRYDPVTRQRVHQRVTLTSSARDGLPTPADEHVILALLYVAKHSNNFADADRLFRAEPDVRRHGLVGRTAAATPGCATCCAGSSR